MDLKTGQFLHFPAGTYDAQMKKPYGNLELFIMKRMWRTVKAHQRMDNNLWDSEIDQVYYEEDTKLLTELGVWGT